MMTPAAFEAQAQSFQKTFTHINEMIQDPEHGWSSPDTLAAIKAGLYNTLKINLPPVIDKGINAYCIADVVTRMVNKGNGIDALKNKPEAIEGLQAKVTGWATSIENALGLKNSPISTFIGSLFEKAIEQVTEKAKSIEGKKLIEEAELSVNEVATPDQVKEVENKTEEIKKAGDVRKAVLTVQMHEGKVKSISGNPDDVAAFVKVQPKTRKPRTSKPNAGIATQGADEAPIAGEAKDLGVTPVPHNPTDATTPTHVEVEKPAGQLSIPFA